MQNDTTDNPNTPPIHVADCGRVRASVWERQANGITQFKLTFTRSFQVEGEWKRGRTFYSDEIPALVEVAARAQLWIDRRKRDAQAQLHLAVT